MFENFKQSSLKDMLTWKDPKVSVLALLIALTQWYFLFQGADNYLTSISRVMHLLLILGLLHRIDFFDFSEESTERKYRWLADGGWRAFRAILPLFRWDNPMASFMVLGIAVGLTILGQFVRYDTGALIVLLLAFTLPVLFLRYKDMLKEKMRTANSAVKKKAELAKEKLSEKARQKKEQAAQAAKEFQKRRQTATDTLQNVANIPK